jgi:hypothetical protein
VFERDLIHALDAGQVVNGSLIQQIANTSKASRSRSQRPRLDRLVPIGTLLESLELTHERV